MTARERVRDAVARRRHGDQRRQQGDCYPARHGRPAQAKRRCIVAHILRHGGTHDAEADRNAEEQIEKDVDVDAVAAGKNDAEDNRDHRIDQDEARLRVGTQGEEWNNREEQAVLLELLEALRPGDADTVGPRQQQQREDVLAVAEIEASAGNGHRDDREASKADEGAETAVKEQKQPDAQRRRNEVVLDEPGKDHQQDHACPHGERRRCVDRADHAPQRNEHEQARQDLGVIGRRVILVEEAEQRDESRPGEPPAPVRTDDLAGNQRYDDPVEQQGGGRNRPAGANVVADQRPERAREIEPERQIIVELEAGERRIEIRAGPCGRRPIGVPALIDVETVLGADPAPERCNDHQRDREIGDAGDRGQGRQDFGWLHHRGLRRIAIAISPHDLPIRQTG